MAEKKDVKTTTFTVEIENELLEKFDAKAKEEARPRSQALRYLMIKVANGEIQLGRKLA